MKIYQLDQARADGWLEQLGRGSDGFAQLCEVVGAPFVAFSVISGVQITALTVDPQDANASQVDFQMGKSGSTQSLPLGEFRQRLADAVLAGDEPSVPPPEEPSAEDLQACLGVRYVLLAPVFDVLLLELRIGDEGTSVVFSSDDHEEEMSVPDFQESMAQRVRAETDRRKNNEPFAIDLSVIPEARRASQADMHEKVSELLGNWPGPLSLLLRTREGQALAPEVRATLAESLGMLGTAYVGLQRNDWAQEVLRLGIQWAQDQREVSADLFTRLGEAQLVEGRHGEAIGLLRRALSLGASNSDALPLLARCFLEREQHLAALLLAEDAIAAGVDAEQVAYVRDASKAHLGESWEAFRRLVHTSTAIR